MIILGSQSIFAQVDVDRERREQDPERVNGEIATSSEITLENATILDTVTATSTEEDATDISDTESTETSQPTENSPSIEEKVIEEKALREEPRRLPKAKLLDRLAVEKSFAKEFDKSHSPVLSYIDVGFSEDESEGSDLASEEIFDIKIYFHVFNPSQQKARLTLNTGIKRGILHDIKIEGATGYRWENDELVIAYIPLLSKGSAIVSLTALPLHSTESLDVTVTPVLKDKSGSVLSSAPSEKASIKPKSTEALSKLSRGAIKKIITEEKEESQTEQATSTIQITPPDTASSSSTSTPEAPPGN
ncbi:hypothetical protein A2704_05630 [Candidatus Kaiserbacteria bacterium RIFCSPHIGHO2_01_FULL_54_36b]|uniref:Uncharacterized protein n=1 Tax=Candidatus Kaiserbacteria bacterium RIFCSPHIGHO2_01_FULL_54_36b TaxID=1798483 RepID=A0A1F6CMQ7_9BACT|nr:MAG: hypothetical protein A2704_05630 [Candidatus Kaiserbacteria bacterium RIFCSPHIGHO2_01_FULL_54_36b]